MSLGPSDPWDVIDQLRLLHLRMLAALHAELRVASSTELSRVGVVQGGDAVYAIDMKGEEILVEHCREWSKAAPFLLIAEGITESGERMFPEGADPASAEFRLIVDPIDGTRGLMYNKRSAWILSAVAPNLGPQTSLQDIRWAVMTEVPTTRARYADQLWASVDGDAEGVTLDITGDEPVVAHAARIQPSRATDLKHGFACLVKFFPTGKTLTAQLEEALFQALSEASDGDVPLVFDDQYISNGGQMYEILSGHDRFIADLRPLIFRRVGAGEGGKLCAHPYDLCTELIARRLGAVVTGVDGRPLNAPLSVHHNVAWVAYANEELRGRIEPVLQRLLAEFGLI